MPDSDNRARNDDRINFAVIFSTSSRVKHATGPRYSRVKHATELRKRVAIFLSFFVTTRLFFSGGN